MQLRHVGALAVTLLCVLAFASCSDDPTSPARGASDDSTAFDKAAAEYLGNSLRGEFEQREFGHRGSNSHAFPGRYPLQLGNRWHYRRIVAFETTLTGQEPTPPEIFRASVQQELIGIEALFGRDYVVQERVIDEGEMGITTQWVRFRQDRSGLYEADVPLNQPPILLGAVSIADPHAIEYLPAAWHIPGDGHHTSPTLAAVRQQLVRRMELVRQVRAGLASLDPSLGKDALENELTRLLYPLHTGQTWVLREDPHVRFTVEGLQVMRLRCGVFPAWRLRLDAEFFGPNDRAVFWVGRVGFVGMAARFEGDVVDLEGNVIGTMRGQEREVLTRFELQRHRRGGGAR